ncbi:ATP-binding cassette domain-containing protein [Cohnella sp. CFH 77786]|uniref:ATP-binding cassette domain-containing protein n=1 Tax=Cohnella sp. CFH 77786 TaxID=2662265 RepID=UPI001C60A61C|nr:ATP-binding cassette domain-containing protein [Cohnella sp. CFH 77786]MBW5444485.1 ATP-binding cassette domain-containing protein [Cohnella sp. CFH 77786]
MRGVERETLVEAGSGGNPVPLTIGGLRGLDGEEDGRASALSLTLVPGTLTLVIGPNGAGKTVFLEKTAGLREPEGMTVHYGAEPLWIRGKWTGKARLNPKALSRCGYAGQSPEQGLFLRSLEEEIRYSLRPYAKEPSLDAASLTSRALEAVGWDSSWLPKDPYRMSGGERRRAALAALFATPAPWLLLDEPTAGLDREGHRKLADHLSALKREGRGILLVSHDSDWALPLADRILLLHPSGEIADCRPEELIANPDMLVSVGLEVPAWMRIVRMAWMAGGGGLERWWKPADAAEALVVGSEAGGNRGVEIPGQPVTGTSDRRIREPRSHLHPLTRYDPRAIWLGYALLSAGLFSLSTWRGLLAGAAIVGLVLTVARIPLVRWKGMILGFVYFGTALAAWAALDFTPANGGPVGWDFEVFTDTLFPFARTLAVLLIGLGVPLVMTPLSLRRALEQLAIRQGRVSAFWQRVVLTVTLTVRFVPVLLAEWERFGRIFVSRGKVTGASPRSWFRRLRGITLPLMLALFRLADDAAIALESRGVRGDVQPTRGSRLQWRWRDTAFAAGAAALAVMLWLAD